MNFERLIGQTFQENEFYELLLFDIEENFESYFSKFMHFYFDRVPNNKIKITEIVYFENSIVMDKTNRKIIEKKEWFEIYENCGHIDLMLCRFDRYGRVSTVRKDNTHSQDSRHGWADEYPREPMTEDEIKLAVQELCGFFEQNQELQNLRSKKAV